MTTEPTEPLFIDLLGKKHGVTLPGFAARLELVVANGAASSKPGVTDLRVCAAAIGLCTRFGRMEKAPSYLTLGCEVLAYGGAMYDLLAEQGVTPRQLRAAATPILSLLIANLPPLDEKVEERAAFSEGGEPLTDGPSASR